MLKTIERAKTVDVLKTLDYRPDTRIVFPWLDQFASMIWKLDKDYLYGTEEKEIVRAGIESIRSVLTGNNSSEKRKLLFCLDWYLDPYYRNDTAKLHEPLKELLRELTRIENEADVIEEAQYLLEAYLEE